MNVVPTSIPDVLLMEPRVFRDERGRFFESYNQQVMTTLGIRGPFVQDNQSTSLRHVLRGLHYQIKQSQGKLVRVLSGEVFDVSVDLRRASPTFGKWVGVTLSADNNRMLWIPPGFAHGFLVRSEAAEFFYKATEIWAPEFERTIVWNDPDLNIGWPITNPPVVSQKDASGRRFRDAELFE